VVAGIFRVNAAATPPCVYHTPAESVLARRRLVQGLTWLLIAIVIGTLVYGLVRLRAPAPPRAAPGELSLEVEASYEGAVVGEPYRVTAIVLNRSDRTRGIKLEISARSLQSFDLLSVDPEAEETEERGQWHVLRLSPLRPQERRPIALDLVPKQAGDLHLVLRLVSDENLFHGQLDFPITVEPRPQTEGPSGEGGERKDEARRRDAQAEGAQ